MTTDSLQHELNGALRGKRLDAVMTLLDAGADPDFELVGVTPIEKPLIAAAKAKFLPGIETLVKAGAQVNGAAYDGITPLIASGAYGCVEAGRWLLDHGADVLQEDKRHENVLSQALTYWRLDFADMLLQQEPRCRGEYLVDAARKVIHRRNLKVARWLLGQGVSPNLTDRLGHNWLLLAQSSNLATAQPLVKLLLDAGADVNQGNSAGDTPLHKALKIKKVPLMLQLLGSGADADLPNKARRSVRQLIQAMDENNELRHAFFAWEASDAAQKIIKASSHPTEIRPL